MKFWMTQETELNKDHSTAYEAYIKECLRVFNFSIFFLSDQQVVDRLKQASWFSAISPTICISAATFSEKNTHIK